MTEISSPFSQFCTPQASMHKQNNTTVQNNIMPKEQAAQPNKKQLDSKYFLIPTGTTVAGALGGFAVAQFQEADKFETLKQNTFRLEKELTEQLNKSRDVIQLNKNISEAKRGLAVAEGNLAKYQNKLLSTQKKSQIDIIKDLIKSAEEMKSSNATELNKYNNLLKSYQEQYIKTPLDSFVKNETVKIKSYKNKITVICAAVGLAIGLGIVLINKYLKKDNK